MMFVAPSALTSHLSFSSPLALNNDYSFGIVANFAPAAACNIITVILFVGAHLLILEIRDMACSSVFEVI